MSPRESGDRGAVGKSATSAIDHDGDGDDERRASAESSGVNCRSEDRKESSAEAMDDESSEETTSMALNSRNSRRLRSGRPGRLRAEQRNSGNKFLPWLPSAPTREGTLEKKSVDTSWFAQIFGSGSTTWNLRHFLLYDTHLFWGKGFSTMHGYGTILSVRDAPEEGPTAFLVEMMAIPKRSLRRSLHENMNFMELISGLCCKPAGFKTMTLRAGTREDKEQWIEALSSGTVSTPLATRMPLDFSEEIPPSPRVSTDSDRSALGSAKPKRYEEPPPPLSPKPFALTKSPNKSSSDDLNDELPFRLAPDDAELDQVKLTSKMLSRIPSALKTEPRFSIEGTKDVEIEQRSKSVTFSDRVDTQIIAKSPSKSGLAAAEETEREARVRTRLQQAAGSFRINESELKVGAKLGIGSFGVVHRAKWNDTDVAFKTMHADEMNDDTVNAFAEEIRMMRALRHPNIVLFIGAVIQPNRMGIVSELMKRGNLEQLLHGTGVQSDTLCQNGLLRRQMAADCARGMLYLHSLSPPVVHHDLKPANLLVDANWTLKVSDFGMSELKNYTYGSNCKAPGGTPEWMAPEALRGDDVSENSDVYSFGVILWELITLQYPWTELSSPVQIVAQVAFLHRRLKIPSWVEGPISELLHDCWVREMDERPSFASIVVRLVGDYPSTWSLGNMQESADERAASILASLGDDDSGSPPAEDDHFIDASDDISITAIDSFAPRGLKPIRTPTPVSTTLATPRNRVPGSEDDSAEETNSFDSSEENSAMTPQTGKSDSNLMSTVNGFRPKLLSPLKTPKCATTT